MLCVWSGCDCSKNRGTDLVLLKLQLAGHNFHSNEEVEMAVCELP